jgi:hypothetical protein
VFFPKRQELIQTTYLPTKTSFYNNKPKHSNNHERPMAGADLRPTAKEAVKAMNAEFI